jgi:exonuclease VII small subunit
MVDTTLNIIVNMQVEAAKAQLKQLSDIVKTMNTQADQLNNPAAKYEKGFKTIQKTVKQNDLLKDVLGEQSKEYRQQQEYLELQQKQLNINANGMNQLRLRTKAFSFDFLTLIFTGMMLEKTFGGMFNGIINSYKKVMGMNSQFNRSTLKMSAAFEYLKFSIANALNNPVILSAIEWFTDRLSDLGDWLQENPDFATAILAVVGAMYAIGKIVSLAGAVAQMGLLFDLMSKSTTATAIANLTKLAGIGLITLSIVLAWDTIKDIMENGFDIESAIRTAVAAALLEAGLLLVQGGGLGMAIKGGLVLGGIVLGLGVAFALFLDTLKSIEETKKMAPGWSKVGKLLFDSIKAMVTTGLGFALAGGLIGGPVGAGIGFVLGTIVAGVGVAIKMLWKDEVDTTELEQRAGSGGGAGARGVEDALNNLKSEYETNLQPVELELESYKQQLKDVETVDLFKGIDLDKFESFRLAMVNIKDPISQAAVALSGEGGLYIGMQSTNLLLESTLLKYMSDFNTYISDGTTLMVNYTAEINTQKTAMDKLAVSTNNAAIAQERLNKAKSAAKSTVNKIIDKITGGSSTKSTTTR